MRKVLYLILLAFCIASCNDWLDVRPETEQKDHDQFSTVDGFFDALVGCYMEMAANDAYGERLSVSNIEALANLWNMPENNTSSDRLEDWELNAHEFTGDNARNAVSAFYTQLFRVIINANSIIKYTDEQGDVFPDRTMLQVVKGEAFAIRAYCQLDMLRLFGQMPAEPGRQGALPYSLGTTIYEIPAYYDFAAYITKLKEDLQQAEDLLKDNDPLFAHTFAELSVDNADIVANNYLLYRQARLNYYAVRALRARLHLYIGENDEAYRVAKELIDARGTDGKAVREMSGAADIAEGYRLCPNECLFFLSKYDIKTNTEPFLIGDAEDVQYRDNSDLAVTTTMLNALYAGEQINSHNRYQSCWNKNVADIYGIRGNYAATKKYWWDDDTEGQRLNCQIVPMLRMSEVYLIAMETSGNLSEVNTWYKKYMVEHNVGTSVDFASLDAAREWVHMEYCREFVAEGQMFYHYKRRGATTWVGRSEPVGENDYILPLPETEYNPNNL